MGLSPSTVHGIQQEPEIHITAPETIKFPASAAEFFDLMRAFFAAPSSQVYILDKMKVANVLSAVRGPDNGDPELKKAWALPVRRSLYGRFAKYVSVPYIDADTDAEVKVRMRPYGDDSGHFTDHADIAFNALGLSVPERNN